MGCRGEWEGGYQGEVETRREGGAQVEQGWDTGGFCRTHLQQCACLRPTWREACEQSACLLAPTVARRSQHSAWPLPAHTHTCCLLSLFTPLMLFLLLFHAFWCLRSPLPTSGCSPASYLGSDFIAYPGGQLCKGLCGPSQE